MTLIPGLPVILPAPGPAFQVVANHPSEDLRIRLRWVIGITGSVGKTSTKEATAAVLGAAMPTLRLMPSGSGPG